MFDDPRSYMWLIPFLPLAGAALTAVFGRMLRGQSHWPCILGAVGACVVSVLLFFAVSDGYAGARAYYTWIQTDALDITVAFRADGLTAIMLLAVTFVGSLIAIYSIGYMHHDAGYARYFAVISLFLFSMTGLVMADNFLLLYAFWEGVGLCSYLLIGFWFTRPSAAAAARKAFLVTRIGDVGMFIGILLLWWHAGSLDYGVVFQNASNIPGLTAICLLLFCGAVGKSAQFPLHVWLPDAMEGPSPVSALIHAATMVTAGVYLVARSMPLFALAPAAQTTVACIGAFTALLAAVIAVTQTDLKRVLAYSTVSQLGYMFLALGSGMENLASAAVVAAIFHLFTHAFFKALLFLGAGSVMHAMGNVIDMRRFSGLRKILPTTHWTFLCGAAALAGFPLLSGFWSKDKILAVTMHASEERTSVAWLYGVMLFLGLVTAGLTAFYTFRAYFKTFWGEERIPPEAGGHAHESPPVMTIPLQILAVFALGIGLVLGITDRLSDFLHRHWIEATFAESNISHKGHHVILLMVGSGVIALLGIAMAWWMYVQKPSAADDTVRSAPTAYALSRNRFYLDEIYNALIVKPLQAVAAICRVLDQYIIDGLVDLFAQVPRFIGMLFRPVQNGLVQFYALLMILGLAGFLLSVLLR